MTAEVSGGWFCERMPKRENVVEAYTLREIK